MVLTRVACSITLQVQTQGMKLIFSLLTLALTLTLSAQECNGFYFLSNKEVQMTMYDKKGEESGKLSYHITNQQKTGNSVTASFTSEMVNEKGKVLSTNAGTYKCTAGVFYVDARVAMPGDQMSAYKDMEVKADEVFIDYPSTMTDGQALKDINFKMQTFNKGSLYSTIVFDQTNRKVSAKEKVTTAAGSWDCWKIDYDAKFKASMAVMNIGVPFNFQVTEWFAPGFGVVKSETRNKNGKLMGSSMITLIKK